MSWRRHSTKRAGAIRCLHRKGASHAALTDEQRAGLESGITYTTDYDALSGADWVLEAATEDLALEATNLRRKREAVVARDGPVDVEHESRFRRNALSVGCALPSVRPSRISLRRHTGTRSSKWSIGRRWIAVCSSTCAGSLRAPARVPLVTRDVVCFMLDRLFDNWCNEAGLPVEQKRPPHRSIPWRRNSPLPDRFSFLNHGERQSDHRRDEYPASCRGRCTLRAGLGLSIARRVGHRETMASAFWSPTH